MNSILQVEDLTGWIDAKKIFGPVNFRLEQGERLRILGKNGSGKTTLIKSIIGIHKEWTGSIKIRSKAIGYKPQNINIYRSLNLREIAPHILGYNEHRYLSLVEALTLGAFLNKPIGILSGGEAQRALLAISLMKNPDILFLDEPFACADPESIKAITDLLNREVRNIIVSELAPIGMLRVDKEMVLGD
jgi:ABC-type Mn2+/Zn2+ transport system ATPase subunit